MVDDRLVVLAFVDLDPVSVVLEQPVEARFPSVGILAAEEGARSELFKQGVDQGAGFFFSAHFGDSVPDLGFAGFGKHSGHGEPGASSFPILKNELKK